MKQKAFDTMKRIISRETLLSYPDFQKPFTIHTDASHTQLGAVISQNDKPIAFYSRKLNPAQTRYTTTERELLSIVETLKEFRNILLGHEIIVHTDHKNLTYKNFNTERVMRWQLILEEFGPTLNYIKGSNNVVADALSRLDLDTNKQITPTTESLAEAFATEEDDLPEDAYPLSFKTIATHQKKDTELANALTKHSKYKLKVFRGGDTERRLICDEYGRIIMPKKLQNRCVQWYHDNLCHPGETRTEETIKQHFFWPNLRKSVHNICKKCDICQRTKKKTQKLGLLPPKTAEATPWEVLCVDLIGPYKINVKNSKKPLVLWCLTMIDPATGWIEIVEIKEKSSFNIARAAEKRWFMQYPWPSNIVLDRGTEFMGDFKQMVAEDFGIKRKPITTRNPQANAMIERAHQTIGHMIRSFQVQNLELDLNDPWSDILAATMFAMRSTVHTTTKSTPAQLVFGRDSILNIQHQADWQMIQKRKQDLINKNNMRENLKRKVYQYLPGQQVLVAADTSGRKFGVNPYKGPYIIETVNNNGTVALRRGAVLQVYNIRNIKPYNT